MASGQSLPGNGLSKGKEDDPFIANPLQRLRTTSLNPNRQSAPIPRSAPTSREASPHPNSNRAPLLHEGLARKLRVLRADALIHPTDLLVCPSDPSLTASWCALTAKIHEAAGPNLSTKTSSRYSAGISNPPSKLWSEYSDVNDIESPFKSFFNTIKHSSSFEMSNCDWLAHSCAPAYSQEKYTTGEGVGSSQEIRIQERNHAKYNSVYFALKKAHLVALVHWTRTFSVAIPQVQYDGEFYTPRDDAILTLAAAVDFFNHPVWGARRCNIIERIDIIIDPTEEGIPYVESYDFAWHVMNMQLPERHIPPSPGSRRGFLRRPFPAYRPPLAARDPYANYGPPQMTDDVMLTAETPDNSQQVAESQEMDLLEQAKIDEDGDSIFGDFMQNVVADFHGSDVGNSPLPHDDVVGFDGRSPQPTQEVEEKGTSLETSEQEHPKIHTEDQLQNSNAFKPQIHSPISPSSQKSLSPLPITPDDQLEKPSFRSSSPSPKSHPRSQPQPPIIKKAFKSPTDDDFNLSPVILGLTLLKTALVNTSPQLSPVSEESSGGKGKGNGNGNGNGGGMGDEVVRKPTITVTPPLEAPWDKTAGLGERRKSSDMRVYSPLAGGVVFSGDGADGKGEEDLSMLEVQTLSQAQDDVSRPSGEDEDISNLELDVQEVAKDESDSDFSIDLDVPIDHSIDEESFAKETSPSSRPNLLRQNKDNSDSSPSPPSSPSQNQEPQDDPYHIIDSPLGSPLSNLSAPSPLEPEDDPYHIINSDSEDSDPDYKETLPKDEMPSLLSPLSPLFPKSPKVLKREVAVLRAVGHGLDGSYWNLSTSTRTRKRKRRASDV